MEPREPPCRWPAERATIQGRAKLTDDAVLRARYLARHPDAAGYVGFRDFNLYRVEIERAHLVAGFGRIHWLDGASALLDTSGAEELRRAETGILDHMNADHADAVRLCATALLGQQGEGWSLTGVDPEGADLRRRSTGAMARLPFERIVRSPAEVREELVRLVGRARQSGAPGSAE